MPPPVNKEKYRRAQRYIDLGRWVVKPDEGLILKAAGQPMKYQAWCGYPALGVYNPETQAPQYVLVHRVIWESVHGEIPDGLEVNHIDGDKANPKIGNLELVTRRENMAHAFRNNLSTALSGQPPGRDHAGAISDELLKAINDGIAAGESQRKMAIRLGVSRTTISWISRGKHWSVRDKAG